MSFDRLNRSVASVQDSNTRDRWCIPFALLWMNFWLLGVLRSFPVVFVAIIDEYRVSREDAAWPAAVFGSFMCIAGIASGYLSYHFSIRSIMIVAALVASLSVSLCSCATKIGHITVFYGAFQGFGIGVIVPLVHVILNQEFSRYRAVATGIAYAGSSLGCFVLPPVTQLLLREFKVSGTFLLLGGIMLNSLTGLFFIREPTKVSLDRRKNYETSESSSKKTVNRNDEYDPEDRYETNLHNEKTNKSILNEESRGKPNDRSYKSILRFTLTILSNTDFMFISIIFAIYFSVSTIFQTVIVDFARGRLIQQEYGVYLVSVFAIGDLVGRLSSGWISDTNCVSRKTTVCVSLAAMSSLLLLTPLCASYELLLAVCVFLGLLNGAIIVNYSALLTDYIGLCKLSIAMGFCSSIVGLFAFLRPMVIGYFRDHLQSYDVLFLCLGIGQLIIVILWLLKSSIQKIKNIASEPRSQLSFDPVK